MFGEGGQKIYNVLIIRHKEAIQSSFDLLGEMVKFSYEACKQMDSILNTEHKLRKAMTMVNNNLVDSNMFIRAMVLAAAHFKSVLGEIEQFVSQSRYLFREKKNLLKLTFSNSVHFNID